MDAIIQRGSALRGTVTVPPDKAVCHRAVLAAAVATGRTEITPWPAADDCQRTLELVRAIGVLCGTSPSGAWIEGRGSEGLRAPTQDLFCGESGTTMRLAAGLLAGQPLRARLCAGPLLSRRPMQRIVEPLSRMGARFNGTRLAAGAGDLYPPLTIEGRVPLQAIRYELPVASAQVKSAILLAGLFADGPTSVIERHQTRDHTERLLSYFGARVRAQGQTVSIEPGRLTSPGRLTLPGDVSSAAFFVVAAACVPGSRLSVRDVGLNPTRTGFLNALERMGASVHVSTERNTWEPRGTIRVESRGLRAITVEAEEVPGVIDELPILMVAASVASGTTRLRGLGELRVKETDRIQSMVRGLQQLGVRIRATGANTVEIEGGTLTGASVASADDHRTAMSLAVAGLLATGRTTVRDAHCVAKSFPEFFEQLRQLTGSATAKTVDKA